MRRIIVSALLLCGGCPEDDPGPSGPQLCTDCDNAMVCPGDQPELNPLDPCDELDATCWYCGPVMRRYRCQANAGGELFWQDNGEVDMCPPPPEPMTGDGTG